MSIANHVGSNCELKAKCYLLFNKNHKPLFHPKSVSKCHQTSQGLLEKVLIDEVGSVTVYMWFVE